MSYVIAAPEYLAAAASDLTNIGSSISSANQFALSPTSNVLAAGADEVSAAMSALFNSHAQVYQALSAQAAQFHAQFVQLMNGGASEYALTEAANASPLQIAQQGALGAINSPSQASAGHPPIGNGADSGPGTGVSGAGRGVLFGGGVAGASGLNGADGGALTGTGAAGGGQGGASGLFATGGVGGIGAPASPSAGPAAMAGQANGSVLTGPAAPAAPPPQSVETAATTRPAAPEMPAAAAPMAMAASSAPAAGPRAASGGPGADATAGVAFAEDGAESET